MNIAQHLASMSYLELKVEKWVQNGFTMGHKNGKPFFIVGAVPGEDVRIKISKETKKHGFGYVVQSLSFDEAKEIKIDSDCSLFGECGGCQYRHIPYERELELKKDSLHLAFPTYKNPVQVISASPIGYRNNVQWHSDKGHIGMLAGNSNSLIPMEGKVCLNLPDELQVENLKKNKRFKKDRVHYFRLDKEGIQDYSRQTQKLDILGRELELPPKSFCQINRFLVEPWLLKIKSLLNGSQSILELFSGVGMIGLSISDQTTNYLGIEIEKSMVQAAQKNAKNLNLQNHKFLSLDLFETSLSLEKVNQFETWILNPPRSGAGQRVMETLVESKAKRVLYSSCHLATLRRDFDYLEKVGYQIKELVLLDFFPRTSHFETLLIAEKTLR